MVLKDIMSISGEPGLFKFIAQGKNAIIVEHLETLRRSSAFGSARISSLDEISVYTEKEDVPLSKVFDAIFEKENGGPAIDYKSDPEKLKTYLEEVLPEYDKTRVYVSDIKKLVHWYNILHSLNMLVKEEPEPVKEEDVKPDTPEDKPNKETGKKTIQKKTGASGKKKDTR
ncbi:MAG TPA: DUF5606 domain-containing protein [Bacteroidales bacterium]|nr:DUF5606 domain-containing protein [Bacteroidales bacterium]HPF03858.1 DUF5606 domain-containing protein [Bacteroidales bacterium]HPJ58463.1 DUF5606 domain-containing protein [Bacteroidales bacterium]HPR11638.1 DUF5606 domain-containing protein [Bacteroidales bacterium]HRW84999.1 DUF5606 domain-containing protein [Bacteroidales bacterium]